jgi:HEAT repeat protein
LAGAGESAVLKAALLGYPAPLVVPEAARLLDAAPPPAKAALIEVLGEKGARGEIERIFHLTEDAEPAIRDASLRALANLAGDTDLPRLVAMLEKATESDMIVRLREAIAAAVLRNPDPERRADSLLALLKSATSAGKIEILKVLPRIGGTGPLRAAVAETAGPDPAVQSAAVGALSRWPDSAAAEELLRLASTTQSREWRRTAVQGYARLVARSSMPPATKLAALEKAIALPGDDEDRIAVLTEVAFVREPESLRLLARGLDRPGLRDAAAAALLDLASRQLPEERWLSGHEAYSVLRRAEASLEGPAARQRAGQIIRDLLRQGGFVPLFDDRSLDGWKGLVADPPKRAKMTSPELATAQAAADETMRAHWTVVDGALAFDGKGESLCTSGDYVDFELLADWKIEKGGDSGFSLRGSPQVQIWDAEANPAGSGGLFNDKKAPSPPLEKADLPVGEWNAFRIVMIGERVTVYLNDKRVVDSTVLENYWERDQPIDSSGPIELLAHGTPLWFRNVFIREIPRETAIPAVPDVEASEGFTPLFGGRDLEGWTGNAQGYAAEDGKIVVHPERGGGNLYTAKEYRDFVLRFDVKLTPAANNGLGLRAPLEGDAAYVGMEIQILEDGSPVYWGLQPYQYHGSIYGIVPARRGVLRPVGEWNSEEVTVRGRRVIVVVNGTTVVDADLDQAIAGGTMDGRDHPGLQRASGHIAFLGHGSPLEFRNIRIKEIR